MRFRCIALNAILPEAEIFQIDEVRSQSFF